MKHLSLFCLISTSLLFSCSETFETNQFDKDIQNIIQVNKTSDSVSLEEALTAANAFIKKNATRNINCGKEAKIECFREENSTLFYVINYPNGGFVVTSATKDYFPVLAFSQDNNIEISTLKNELRSWVEDTKRSIERSHIKSDSIKMQMKALWDKTDLNNIDFQISRTRSSYTQGQLACWQRLDELQMQYGNDGWRFAPLSDVRNVFEQYGLGAKYEELLYSANYNHSLPSSSVIGWNEDVIREIIGPFLNTHWDQGEPFNNLCDGKPAGCAAIALTQIMKYYQFPHSFTYNGYSFTWSNIPDYPDANSDQAVFVKMIRDIIGTQNIFGYMVTRPGDFEDGISNLGYYVSTEDNDYMKVSNHLVNHRPVIMLGNDWNMSWLPGDLEYAGESHYWVADGINRRIENRVRFFTEWQPYDNGTFTPGHGTLENPDFSGGVQYSLYHYNWGHGGSNDGWFVFDDTEEDSSLNYEHSRKNIYISRYPL